jgi:hypothetical protein
MAAAHAAQSTMTRNRRGREAFMYSTRA